MYVPLFNSITKGTLHGRWPDIGLWPIVLSLADRHGVVDCTQAYIAAVTGLSVAEVTACMQRFCAPDPGSRTKDCDGARLMLLDAHRDWGWLVVNHGKYAEKARKRLSDEQRTEDGRNAERMRLRQAALTRDDPTGPAMTHDDRPSAASASAAAIKKKTRAARSVSATEFPKDFTLTEKMAAQARTRHSDCDPVAMFTHFRAHHEAHGNKFKSWPQAWVTWLGNMETFGYPKAQTTVRQWD